MNKSNLLLKYLNNISNSINSLLVKNLNKLNISNLRNLSKNSKIILTFVAVIIVFISYLLLPTFYNKVDISRELKNKLSNKLSLDFEFSENINYNFFPSPHFTINKITLLKNNKEISKGGKFKIYISFNNLFHFKNIEIKDIILEKVNFDLNRENYKFFTKLLDNNFESGYLEIKNSNIFFKNTEKEVLFINKILNMKYYYDPNEYINILEAKNKIFNIPYEIKLLDKKNEQKLLTNLNLNLVKLQIENELKYGKEIVNGKSSIKFNKLKSYLDYEVKDFLFSYKIFDKIENPKFTYNGRFNFKPFYSDLIGETKELNLTHLFGSNAFVVQLLKTKLFNNSNIDFKLILTAEKIKNNLSFENINIKSRIQEGLIDLDNTEFKWKNFADFKFTDSLVFVRDGELVLDGKLSIEVKNYNEIYTYLLTPKKFRNKIKKIDLNFSYNFNQKIAELTDIKIDNKIDNNINIILNKIILKQNNLQNKVYFKNLLNEAIKSYFG